MTHEATTYVPGSADADETLRAAINAAAIVDRSSVGKLSITGADSLDLLHRLSTNDLLNLAPFSARDTTFTTDKGRIVDYVRILVLQDSLLMLTSPEQADRLKFWIDKYTIMEDVQTTAVTHDWAMYSIVGPEAALKALGLVGAAPIVDTLLDLRFANAAVILDCQKYFDTYSVNIFVPRLPSVEVWDELICKGRELGLAPMDAQTYECFRIIHGIPKEGNELVLDFNPLEVGLHHAISFTKGCYIGQEVIARLDTYQKIYRELVCISFSDRLERWHSEPLLSDGGETVGMLTSFAPVPSNGRYLGLGVVHINKVAMGGRLRIASSSVGHEGVLTKVFSRKIL